ncbi:MAG: hypothetical protein V4537_12275 [Pseudomonadota bacterium]
MTIDGISLRPVRALWFTVLALLLAIQSAAGGHGRVETAGDSVQTLRIVAAVPTAVQFRDAAKVVTGAARAVAPKLGRESHNGDPGLPGRSIALVAGDWDDAVRPVPSGRTDRLQDDPADRYHARAPPRIG